MDVLIEHGVPIPAAPNNLGDEGRVAAIRKLLEWGKAGDSIFLPYKISTVSTSLKGSGIGSTEIIKRTVAGGTRIWKR